MFLNKLPIAVQSTLCKKLTQEFTHNARERRQLLRTHKETRQAMLSMTRPGTSLCQL